MPMYMDIHEIPGATAEDVAKAHCADVETQRKYGVEYHKYWFNERSGKIFCLCSAPSPEVAAAVHREAHGLVAAKIIEVAPEVAEGFLGGSEVNTAGAALLPGVVGNDRDPGIADRSVHRYRRLDCSRNALGRTRPWLFFRSMMRLSEMPWAHGAVARSSTPETASWRVSCRPWRRLGCATRIQRALAQHEQENRELPVKVRIGAAAGEPVENHLDLFGSTVQLAARLCSHAQPEQSLVSNVVAELCIGKGLAFQDLGEISLKGFDRPIRVHAIQQPGEAAPH
jgi:hypothetical protein